MTALAIALVLLSALLHASWNLLSKDSRDRWGFFLAQGVTALAFWLPLLVLLRPTAPIGAVGGICLAASGMIHAGYAAALLKSYDAGDLSVAYPLGRIFLGEGETAYRSAGALIIAVGGALIVATG